jgi:hypothetical protein
MFTSIVFHLILTIALIWYQRRQQFHPRPLTLSIFWYLVSVVMSLIESVIVTGQWFSGLLVQGAVVGLFYLPAVFLALGLARRWHDGLWRPFLSFLGLALVATLLAAAFLAYAPWARGSV